MKEKPKKDEFTELTEDELLRRHAYYYQLGEKVIAERYHAALQARRAAPQPEPTVEEERTNFDEG